LQGEDPIDDHNHALGALRYLVSRLDARFLARLRRRGQEELPALTRPGSPRTVLEAPRLPDDDHLWTPL
jgi:hypothetical protein